MKKIVLLFVVIVSLNSCGNRELTPNDFRSWVENSSNGLIITKELSNMACQAMFTPLKYIAIKELSRDDLDIDKVQLIEKELDGLQYYTIKIKDLRGTADENYGNAMYNYFANKAQQNIVLKVNSDTIPCSLYHFENTAGITDYFLLNVAFKSSDEEKSADRILIFDGIDQGLGKAEFEFESNVFNELSKLKIK